MFRATLALTAAATVLTTAVLTAAGTAAAASDPKVPDARLAEATRTLDPDRATLDVGADAAVRRLDLTPFVLPLEEESAEGSKVTVRISADVLFDFNKADLTRSARDTIARLAPRLRTVRGTIQVTGHSDSVGSDSYNLSLSQKRAEAVRAALLRVLKSPVEVEAKGFGERKPVAPNRIGKRDNPQGRAKNRRVDITYDRS
ncbi:OmpA family protein [Actinomadura kijaniata]|uniref:OmpA family protein n=1 Tax=Actinomadura kijaniata TaxID=46161 RepID=UPI00082C593C|nr:OmpA family protein [Actinomadura kijaniata]